MDKIIPKFDDLLESLFDEKITVTLTNIDDIFTTFRESGVEGVKVNWKIMLCIAKFMVANIQDADDEKVQRESLKILQEGRVDKFLGVNLYFDE